jgi:DNA polymerase III epsilon subunit-like protein
MYLFFDTETTGLPKNYRAPASDSDNWPRLIQIAWCWYDEEGSPWEGYSYIIKPEGFIIPDEVAKLHRVTQERALAEGLPLADVIADFSREVTRADQIVAHNIDFDDKIISAEMFRLGVANVLEQANKFCTMKNSVDFCRIPGNYGRYKWPNLDELHNCLFGESFPDAHDALVDVRACARCFFELKKRNFSNF